MGQWYTIAVVARGISHLITLGGVEAAVMGVVLLQRV